MKAFIIDRYGKHETGRLAEVPDPLMQDDEVLIEIHAASVNPLDMKIRSGEFKLILPYRMPVILGNDVAGVVVRTGARVSRFKPGDEVYARPDQDRIGGFAEFIAIKESSVALKPRNLDTAHAASLPLVSLTAWQVLVETARVKPGQKVLIHAGSGGVGSVAIQLAKHLGAFVATTTSTGNLGWVEALGADLVIDYTRQKTAAGLRDYDVVLNSLGKDVLHASLQVLRPGGRLVSISGPPTPDFAGEQGLAWPLKQVMRALSWRIRKQARQRRVGYDFVFMRADGKQLGEITALVEAGIINPVVDSIYPLDETAKALHHVEQGRAKGKVVIRVK